MKAFRIVLAVAIFASVSFADVPAGRPQGDDAEKKYRRGVQFAEGDGVVQDYSDAARFYRKAAEAGYAPAQYDLGYLYETGRGVGRDPEQAAIWYRKAAEQGDAQAQNNLGALYATGQRRPPRRCPGFPVVSISSRAEKSAGHLQPGSHVPSGACGEARFRKGIPTIP